jgi:hypothetical protein
MNKKEAAIEALIRATSLYAINGDPEDPTNLTAAHEAHRARAEAALDTIVDYLKEQSHDGK